jgi:predicted nucleotidyltransferase
MINDINIRETILDLVKKIKNDYNPDRIILFGSYAYGIPNKDSDIDLLIIKDTQDRPIDRRVIVRRIVSDPKRFIPFETIVLTPDEIQKRLEIGDQFVQEIIIKGEVLYKDN